jgi:hypothetical protein
LGATGPTAAAVCAAGAEGSLGEFFDLVADDAPASRGAGFSGAGAALGVDAGALELSRVASLALLGIPSTALRLSAGADVFTPGSSCSGRGLSRGAGAAEGVCCAQDAQEAAMAKAANAICTRLVRLRMVILLSAEPPPVLAERRSCHRPRWEHPPARLRAPAA